MVHLILNVPRLSQRGIANSWLTLSEYCDIGVIELYIFIIYKSISLNVNVY